MTHSWEKVFGQRSSVQVVVLVINFSVVIQKNGYKQFTLIIIIIIIIILGKIHPTNM